MAAATSGRSFGVGDIGEEKGPPRFVAVVEKQGQCEFQLMPAADGTPLLIATPTTDSRASVCSPLPDTCMSLCLPDCFLQGFPDGLNLNHLCVRSTKNARGDFKVRRAARHHFPLT
jgi:hypothetical protein